MSQKANHEYMEQIMFETFILSGSTTSVAIQVVPSSCASGRITGVMLAWATACPTWSRGLRVPACNLAFGLDRPRFERLRDVKEKLSYIALNWDPKDNRVRLTQIMFEIVNVLALCGNILAVHPCTLSDAPLVRCWTLATACPTRSRSTGTTRCRMQPCV